MIDLFIDVSTCGRDGGPVSDGVVRDVAANGWMLDHRLRGRPLDAGVVGCAPSYSGAALGNVEKRQQPHSWPVALTPCPVRRTACVKPVRLDLTMPTSRRTAAGATVST